MSIAYKDYYKILGVARDATAKEIKSAYRRLARKHHPDNPDGNEETFKDINEAYDVLGDPDKRQRFDSLGQHWRHGSTFEPPPGWGGMGGGGRHQQINLEELLRQQGMGGGGFGGHGAGFSSFFDMLFGPPMGGMPGGMGAGMPGHGHPHARQQRKPAPILEQPLALALETIAHGGEQTVRIGGKTLTVTIPQGIGEGQKIRLSGQGPRGEDVHLIIQYQPHTAFTTEGHNLLHTAKVPLSTLALGGEITVPTLDGKAVTLTIPAGAQGGQKLRLRGQGLPQQRTKTKPQPGHGDLMVILQAAIPKHLTDEQRNTFEALKAQGL